MSFDFDISESRDGEWVRVTVNGDLTFASAGALDERLDRLRAEAQPVRLNLSRVGFMDSNGLTVIVRALNESRTAGWKLEIERDVSSAVADRFKHSGLDRFLGW